MDERAWLPGFSSRRASVAERRGRVRWTLRLALCALALSACDPAAPPSGGDSGVGIDAGPGADGGPDAPFLRPDAGAPGAALEPLDVCDDVVDTLYATPSGLPAFDPSVRGALLGCALVQTISASDLATRLSGVPGVEHTGGDVRMYVIAYRTEREPRGVGGISTALVLLPDVARAARVPTVLALHGTVGVADACAPSRFVREGLDVVDLPAPYVDALLLPYAAAGLPVVAPDYAGLGTEGVHGYGNWLDAARSSVDGVRALRALLPPDRLEAGTLVYGHSQGGGVAIAVAALADEAPDVELSSIVALAPGYDIAPAATLVGLSSFALTPLLRATAALYAYADYANLTTEEARWGEPFAPALRDTVTASLGSECYVDAIGTLDTASTGYVPPGTIGELFDPTFVAAVQTCTDGGTCADLAGAFVLRDRANEPRLAAGGPPLLVLGSNDDEINTPASLGCVLDRLRADGTSLQLCMADAGDHLAMMGATAGYAIDWSIAAATGAAPPPCPGAPARPRCALF